MQKYPHHYSASAVVAPTGPVTLSSPGLTVLTVESPPEFDGPGGFWSPETLLMGSVVNCLVLTWRSVAAHNGFPWLDLRVDAAGVLDRVDRVARFTEIRLAAQLDVPEGTDTQLAARLLHKAAGA